MISIVHILFRFFVSGLHAMFFLCLSIINFAVFYDESTRFQFSVLLNSFNTTIEDYLDLVLVMAVIDAVVIVVYVIFFGVLNTFVYMADTLVEIRDGARREK